MLEILRKADQCFDRWVRGPIWHLVWPRECAMCRRILKMDETQLCCDCLTRLPKTEEGWHRDNRVECLFRAGDERKRTTGDKFVRGAAYCFYPKGHPIRNAIQEMKFDSRPEIGRMLGRMAAEEWAGSGFFEGIDCLMPIPLHRRRMRERGYNQAEWIARGIGEVTGIPIDARHLGRIIDNDHQSKKNIDERQQLADIFSVRHPEELKGKHVLLIDDVITSGTTMRRAMDVLHPIPRCTYSVFSLAIAHD